MGVLSRRRGILSVADGALDLAHLPYSLLDDRVDTATSLRTSVSPEDGNANTEGAKIELEPSLSEPCGGIILSLITSDLAPNGTNQRAILSLYTGPDESEVLWCRVGVSNLTFLTQVFIPGHWAAGTRLSVTLQTLTGTFITNPLMIPHFFVEDVQYFSASPAENIGFTLASTQGTPLTAVAASNTKSAWTQLVAVTDNDLAALIVSFNLNISGQGHPNGQYLVDIGIGGAGSETVLIPDLWIRSTSTEQLIWAVPQTYLVDVPAGSRLSARYQSSLASGSHESPAVALTGIRPA